MKLTRNIGRALHKLMRADTGRSHKSRRRTTMTVCDGAKGVMTGLKELAEPSKGESSKHSVRFR
jgi:hypothetical protein